MSPVAECERLVLALHDLIRFGYGDSEEADDIRDDLDYWYRKLSASEIQDVSNLSGDLYLLAGNYICAEDDPEPELDPLKRAYRLYLYWRDRGFFEAAKRFEAFWLKG